MTSTGTEMPSAANTASAASSTRARFRCASARRGRAALVGDTLTSGRVAHGSASTEIFLPVLTNGAYVPYSLNGTSTPIVRQTGRQSETPGAGEHGGIRRTQARRRPDDRPPLTHDPADIESPGALDPKRFRALAVIAVAQLMVVLDASVVIIALPSAQRSLHISTANRQWMLTAYTLAFAGLLLLGGRIADYLGRKRMFIVSLIGFAAASALGGLAQNSAMLFGARALQGAFAAIMAPAGPLPADRGLHRTQGARPGLRRLRRHRRRRRGHRPHPGRSAHPVRLVALDPPDQCAHRHRRRHGRVAVHDRESQPGSSRLRHPGRHHGDRWAPRAGLRLHQGGIGRLGVVDHRHLLRFGRRLPDLLRPHWSDGRPIRSCPCGSCWTGTGAARSWPRSWWEWPCSERSSP